MASFGRKLLDEVIEKHFPDRKVSFEGDLEALAKAAKILGIQAVGLGHRRGLNGAIFRRHGVLELDKEKVFDSIVARSSYLFYSNVFENVLSKEEYRALVMKYVEGRWTMGTEGRGRVAKRRGLKPPTPEQIATYQNFIGGKLSYADLPKAFGVYMYNVAAIIGKCAMYAVTNKEPK